jgi:type II secretory pathway component PulF
MDSNFEMFIGFAIVFLLLMMAFGAIGGFVTLMHFLLTTPMRRAERARLFLDLIELALDRGQPVEEGLLFISERRGKIMGGGFHSLAACLQKGMRLADAIAAVPRLLPPQVVAMLKAGQGIGDIRKVLPACRQMLKDSVSQTRGAMSYAVVLAFVITPVLLFMFGFISIMVLPKVVAISQAIGAPCPLGLVLLTGYRAEILFVQSAMLILVWLAAFLYISSPRSMWNPSDSGPKSWFAALLYASGPRVFVWVPFLDRLQCRLPWRFKRMQRDFSAMLAILLDAGMPEPEAVTLAAECTANTVFRQRAELAVANLKIGKKLTEVVQNMDDEGEFRWRLTNACHAHDGFLKALTGWHEALDAKAFQREQAAAHAVTTALVLFNGVFVGAVVTSVFMFLVSVINTGLLW